eukprot:5308265-Pleurochrysis_carterae.AAC.1
MAAKSLQRRHAVSSLLSVPGAALWLEASMRAPLSRFRVRRSPWQQPACCPDAAFACPLGAKWARGAGERGLVDGAAARLAEGGHGVVRIGGE